MKNSVYLFSFFNSNKKNIKKYSQIYKYLNFDTTEHITKIPSSISYTGWKYIRNKSKVENPEKYKIAHVMSGGIFPYYNYRLSNNNFKPNYLIYDSGPYLPCPTHISNYVSNLIPNNINNLIIKPTNILFDTLWKLEGLDTNKEDFIKFLISHNNILILKSHNDNFILKDDVNKFIKEYKTINKSGNIKYKWWNDSNHVCHYKEYNKEYVNEIQKFIS